MLEEDGIKCFDLERQSLGFGAEDFSLLRKSLGGKSAPSMRPSIEAPKELPQKP